MFEVDLLIYSQWIKRKRKYMHNRGTIVKNEYHIKERLVEFWTPYICKYVIISQAFYD